MISISIKDKKVDYSTWTKVPILWEPGELIGITNWCDAYNSRHRYAIEYGPGDGVDLYSIIYMHNYTLYFEDPTDAMMFRLWKE